MARRFMMDKDDRFIDVTGTDEPYNRIEVTETRPPVVEGMTIDMTRAQHAGPVADPMSQFNPYEQQSPRRIGTMPGGERSVVTDRGAPIITGADRRLQGDYGGIRILDGESVGTDKMGNRIKIDNNPEGFAPIVSQDGRLSLSPRAIDALGQRQIQDEGAAQAMLDKNPGNVGMAGMNNRILLRSVLQKQADQGFVRPGTDQANRITMDQTTARADQKWLNRGRPRDVMDRVNTSDKIMAGADASRMTPQIMTQDGVMAGWDPQRQTIVSDSSGAQAMAASKTKDKTLGDMTRDELLQRKTAMLARQLGELDTEETRIYQGYISQNKTKEAEDYKAAVQRTKWHPEMKKSLDEYDAEINRRDGVTAKPTSVKQLGSMKAR